METEDLTNDSAQAGAPDPQIPVPAEPPQGAADQQPQSQPTLTQAEVDRIVAERLKRAQDKWKADQEAKAKADAEAAEAERQKAQGEWEALARKHEAKVTELDGKLQTTAADLEKATALITTMLEGKKEGLPEPITKLLEGRSLFEQLEIADAFLAAQPAAPAENGQPRPSTKPTPAPQGNRELTPEERRQRAARIW